MRYLTLNIPLALLVEPPLAMRTVVISVNQSVQIINGTLT